jgi:hypothetical protein
VIISSRSWKTLTIHQSYQDQERHNSQCTYIERFSEIK